MDKYTILIGSFARGTNNKDSDLDIVRIGHQEPIAPLYLVPENIPVSYIDYDYSSFEELYDQGSLFLYHAFNEGKLLKGEEKKWEFLKNNFVVSRKFTETINEYKNTLSYIDSYPNYEQAYIAYLSNIFKSLKNIAIFKLAEAGIYEFDKYKAISQWSGLDKKQISLFVKSNNAFERGVLLHWLVKVQLESYAIEWKKNHKNYIKELNL